MHLLAQVLFGEVLPSDLPTVDVLVLEGPVDLAKELRLLVILAELHSTIDKYACDQIQKHEHREGNIQSEDHTHPRADGPHEAVAHDLPVSAAGDGLVQTEERVAQRSEVSHHLLVRIQVMVYDHLSEEQSNNVRQDGEEDARPNERPKRCYDQVQQLPQLDDEPDQPQQTNDPEQPQDADHPHHPQRRPRRGAALDFRPVLHAFVGPEQRHHSFEDLQEYKDSIKQVPAPTRADEECNPGNCKS
mmetsp:Transcript_43919/g.116010  ORF Transcript_43919/g.116010 Transcript_43919/m.116010 type:complete len:245 (+) Transcript_43919:424-1158(+)